MYTNLSNLPYCEYMQSYEKTEDIIRPHELVIIDIVSSILLLYAVINLIMFTRKRDHKLNKISNILNVQRKFNKNVKRDLYMVMRTANKTNTENHTRGKEIHELCFEFDKFNNSITHRIDDFEYIIKKKFKNISKKFKQLESTMYG